MSYKDRALEILGIADVMTTEQAIEAISKILDEVWNEGYFNGCCDSEQS